MKLILNIVWLVTVGWWTALAWYFAGLISFITILLIPVGIVCFRIGTYNLWPFGRYVMDRYELGESGGFQSGVNLFLNIIWLLLCGWYLALGHLVAGVFLSVTIIGIPWGFANFKMIRIALMPFGKRVLNSHELRQVRTSMAHALRN